LQRELGTNRIGRRRREPADRAVQPSNKATIEPALGAPPSAAQRGQRHHPRRRDLSTQRLLHLLTGLIPTRRFYSLHNPHRRKECGYEVQ